MLLKLMPWRFLLRSAARYHGLVDPLDILAKVRSFAQPSEVKEPLELVRANILFQARGLVNTRSIQFNLDWVWPYWVERQFNPRDHSFVPRASSVTHINLTQRNWTAVGLPEIPLYPLVDPRGLVTPLYDGWSVDVWLLPGRDAESDGSLLLPSKAQTARQKVELGAEQVLTTRTEAEGAELRVCVRMLLAGRGPTLEIEAEGLAEAGGRLVFALRPYNAEGVRFVETIAYDEVTRVLVVDEEDGLTLPEPPEELAFSTFDEGDVLYKLLDNQVGAQAATACSCRVGLATAAAVYDLAPGTGRTVKATVELGRELARQFPKAKPFSVSWGDALSETPTLSVPDEQITHLYNAAEQSMLLLTAHEVVPGPFTYRRFWFRDACLMLNGLLCMNLFDRAEKHLATFPDRQKGDGYFESQEGEWDANGQVLWILDRYRRLTGRNVSDALYEAAKKGARWIVKKRITNKPGTLHNGLFPAGFSAEHLGPNDYYFWDDFWGIAGLMAMARMARERGDTGFAQDCQQEAARFEADVFAVIAAIPPQRSKGAIPASPYRRMDAGAIGSMVADYPLRLTAPGDHRIRKTFDFLMENCRYEHGFFQDMVHSGVNAYLSFDLAQTCLREGDPRFREIMRSVGEMASATGHWPEAAHPFSGGGCMGDGQHGWAAAEWLLLVRALFVREEGRESGHLVPPTGKETRGEGPRLMVGQGLFPEWLESEEDSVYGPTPTPHGPVTVRLTRRDGTRVVQVEGDWRGTPPPITVAVPGYMRVELSGSGVATLVPCES